MKKRNLFDIEDIRSEHEEAFEELLRTPDLFVERIISTGQTTPEDEWYDQEQDEWVALLQGEAKLLMEEGERITMKPGDWVLIPARQKHRVVYTSRKPECIWLAIHGSLK